jgi:hypothetical protein
VQYLEHAGKAAAGRSAPAKRCSISPKLSGCSPPGRTRRNVGSTNCPCSSCAERR